MRPLALLALPALLIAAPGDASRKPCRDARGRVIACEKERKPVARCKDAQGRFVRCDAPGVKPTRPSA